MRTENNISFDNSASAFAHRSDSDLRSARFLFRIMSNPFVVRVMSTITVWAVKIGLPVSWLIRKTIFRQFCGGEDLNESLNVAKELHRNKVGAILDFSVEGKDDDMDFERTKCEVIKIIHKAKDNPAIPYTSLKVTGVGRFGLLEKINMKALLTEEEEKEWKKLKERIDSICNCAFSNNVPVYFDAEESWIQDAIDSLAEDMMWKYNDSKAIVLTTVQMYRHDRLAYLTDLVRRAKIDGKKTGIKLVRGAYWEKENAYAASHNRISAVHQNKKDTDDNFDSAVEFCLRNIDIVTLCAGTHNTESTMSLLEKMKELGIKNDDPNVYFSQLYGMSDNITYNLASQGYNVTKYLPYGPIRSVIPYLIRRAEENTSISGQMGRELSLISTEIERRNEQKLLK